MVAKNLFVAMVLPSASVMLFTSAILNRAPASLPEGHTSCGRGITECAGILEQAAMLCNVKHELLI